jgi:transposase
MGIQSVSTKEKGTLSYKVTLDVFEIASKKMHQIEERLAVLVSETGYKLETMDGIDVVTAAGFIAEIGDIGRFASPDKLARFAGIAPLLVGSGDNHKHYKSKQGNRNLDLCQ